MTEEAQKYIKDTDSRIASLEKTVSELVKGQQTLQEQQEATKKGQKKRMTAIERKIDIQNKNLKEFLSKLTQHIAPNDAGSMLGDWKDPENPGNQDQSDTEGDEEEDSSSESSDEDSTSPKAPDNSSSSRSAASKLVGDDNQKQVSYTLPETGNSRIGVSNGGQEAPVSEVRTSVTATGSSRDTESRSSPPTMPMMPQMDPQELKKLQATTGQAMGLSKVDLSNAQIAYMGNLLVINTKTISGIPESWTQASSNQRSQDPLVEAVSIPTMSASGLEDLSKNG